MGVVVWWSSGRVQVGGVVGEVVVLSVSVGGGAWWYVVEEGRRKSG